MLLSFFIVHLTFCIGCGNVGANKAKVITYFVMVCDLEDSIIFARRIQASPDDDG